MEMLIYVLVIVIILFSMSLSESKYFHVVESKAAAGKSLDLPSLKALINTAYAYEHEQGIVIPSTERITIQELKELLSPQRKSDVGDLLLLVCTENGKEEVIGCIKVVASVEEPGCGEWGCLAISSKYRGHGLGKILVNAAEERLKELGCHTGFLQLLYPTDHILPSKERLRAWYNRMGYNLQVPGDIEASSIYFERGGSLGRFVLANPATFTKFTKQLS